MASPRPDADTDPTPGRTNVVLTGFMGTGKTTVGRALADRLGCRFVDTDQLIEADHGPIPVIFAEQGESGFRAIEHALAQTLTERTNTVIATGGRFMLDPANAALLEPVARVFCLVAPIDIVLQRVLGDGTNHRPLLDHPDPATQVRTLLRQRSDAYAVFESVDTAERTPEEIAAELEARLRAPNH